jgi:hypothetical protein
MVTPYRLLLGGTFMFGTLINKIKLFLKEVRQTATQRRQKKLAEIAGIEKRERKALVEGLTKKLQEAHADCEQNHKAVTMVELSFKEIIYIEEDLRTWTRYLRESEIYKAPPQR